MLIKPFFSPKEDIDDIKNITQKSRYIFIYRYDSPHACSYSNIFGQFNSVGNFYDIYLINDSQVDGIGFYITKGVKLQNRNCYRGYSQDLLMPDGKTLNYNATITFIQGTYLNRVMPKELPQEHLSIISADTCSGYGPAGNSFEEELYCKLGTDIIQPFPQYYNVEDQMWLSNKHNKTKIGDFMYDHELVPRYTLSDLVDQYTKIAIVDIPSKGNVLSQELLPYAVDPTMILNNGRKASMESLKSTITNIFIELFMQVSRSVFSAVDIIIDLDTGEFDVKPTNAKFVGLDTKTLALERLKIAAAVSEEIDDIVEMTQDVPDELYYNNLCPNRLSFHIDNYNSTIRLSNIYQNTIVKDKEGNKTIDHLGASGKLSSSDSDDLVQVWANGIG